MEKSVNSYSVENDPLIHFNVKTHRLFAMSSYVDIKLDCNFTKSIDINSLPEMHELIFNQIPQNSIGFGGYLEERHIYHRGDTTQDYQVNDEPRTVHLALDFWTRIGTPVYSVMSGLVHSFSFNPVKGQFGGCIITEHEIVGEKIHLLYGHLSAKSILKIVKSSRVSAGELIGYIGSERENGEWPPHLHFQIIRDMEGFSGDYFGVAAKSKISHYVQNCPDPNLILKLY